MKVELLLKDPVFQLNILLAKEQPPDHFRVRPLFHQLRFSIEYIEQPFFFPDELIGAVEASGIEISTKPEPELMLSRSEDNKALYFEAKAGSFGPESSNRRQALGHLLAAGPAFSEVYAPLTTCLLCYVLPAGEHGPMADCLAGLSMELSGKGLRPGQYSVHELSVEDSQLVYAWDQAFCDHVGSIERRAVLINHVEDETDPAPLLLIFSDEDCPNCESRDFYRRALIEQVRASLLCDLHSLEVGVEISMTVDEVLVKTTEELFNFLGKQRQKSLRRFVRTNVLGHLFDHWKEKQPGVMTLAGNELTIQWSTGDQKEEFLEWLEDRRRAFPLARPPQDQPTLFDMHGEDATS
jgi:hypothetical protein